MTLGDHRPTQKSSLMYSFPANGIYSTHRHSTVDFNLVERKYFVLVEFERHRSKITCVPPVPAASVGSLNPQV